MIMQRWLYQNEQSERSAGEYKELNQEKDWKLICIIYVVNCEYM